MAKFAVTVEIGTVADFQAQAIDTVRLALKIGCIPGNVISAVELEEE